MMKHSLSIAAVAAIGLAGLAGQWLNLPVPRPVVHAVAYTPEQMQRTIEIERRQRHFIHEALIAAQVYEANGCDPWLAERTAKHAIAAGLPTRLVAADVIVESSCRPGVISPKGAVGLTQVMPQIWHVTQEELLDPDRNLEVGTQVLAGYVQRFGVHDGLRHYLGTGATDGNTDGDTYATRVETVAYGRKQ